MRVWTWHIGFVVDNESKYARLCICRQCRNDFESGIEEFGKKGNGVRVGFWTRGRKARIIVFRSNDNREPT